MEYNNLIDKLQNCEETLFIYIFDNRDIWVIVDDPSVNI